MKVIDLLKEKSDRLAKNRDDFIESLNPQLKGYFADAMNHARNSQWLSWVLDHKRMTSGSDTATEEIFWPHAGNAEATALLDRLTNDLNETVFVGDWLSIDQARIDAFAEVSGDHQWIHTDPERAAAESPFRSTIAHGFLTLSLIPLLTDAAGSNSDAYPGVKMIVNKGLNQARYPYPVLVGAKIRAVKKLTRVLTVRRGIELSEEVTIEIHNCRRPACVAELISLLIY